MTTASCMPPCFDHGQLGLVVPRLEVGKRLAGPPTLSLPSCCVPCLSHGSLPEIQLESVEEAL